MVIMSHKHGQRIHNGLSWPHEGGIWERKTDKARFIVSIVTGATIRLQPMNFEFADKDPMDIKNLEEFYQKFTYIGKKPA
jgi:hypothetical protein